MLMQISIEFVFIIIVKPLWTAVRVVTRVWGGKHRI